MGTYVPQRNSATMLYLRDPLPSSHSETQFPSSNMIMYTNSSSSSGPYSDALPSDSNTLQHEVLLNFGGSRDQLSTWKNDRNEMMMMQQEEGTSGVLQGLSLSLGTNVPSVLQVSNLQYNPDFTMSFENEDGFQNKQLRDGEYMISGVQGSNSDAANDIPAYVSVARAVPNSKYLKAAQELLDEVVNVKKATKEQNPKKELRKDSKNVEGELEGGASDPSSSKASGSSPSELSVAEKQELQNKMTKLLSMLEEVDRRYRQYYHQMQIVVSSFDAIAGSGSAKPYTSLALQTISRHFRCLRDAINGQINAARKSIGEEDAYANDKGIGISRLRYVDQQLRQQRALQQIGMMQQHAWRPQRGLPETSVSILRAWLFEHFLHPYPKDSDKIMLARQTGLTRSQVSNWFINARVRLWKPMVEEMYKEEAGEADIDSISSSDTTQRATKPSDDKTDHLQQGTTSTGQSKSDQVTDVEMTIRSDTNFIFQSDYGIGKTKETNDPNPYDISEMERFVNVGGVSLTLGLQQCEGGANRGFVSVGEIDVYNTAGSGMGNETAEFECIDSGNRSHQFVSSLLPSFT
ncbi:Transcription factor MEIS1 [Handroanthus impetiginosus]|uniref:Transcription factor MEIS1 n=1 Tax=Handroanthus impetiginosus TaxID=429701 RepID=A0A2G9H3K8_9LAMI|nr:Transcription factor MEIS1 [Handroanthus impetiginosus]